MVCSWHLCGKSPDNLPKYKIYFSGEFSIVSAEQHQISYCPFVSCILFFHSDKISMSRNQNFLDFKFFLARVLKSSNYLGGKMNISPIDHNENMTVLTILRNVVFVICN